MSIAALAYVLLLVGCVNDDFRQTGSGDDEGDFVLSIRVPGITPATYAIPEKSKADYAVDEMDVF